MLDTLSLMKSDNLIPFVWIYWCAAKELLSKNFAHKRHAIIVCLSQATPAAIEGIQSVDVITLENGLMLFCALKSILTDSCRLPYSVKPSPIRRIITMHE